MCSSDLSHQPISRTGFITILELDMVQLKGQLSIRGDLLPNYICTQFLTCRNETEISTIPIFDSPQLRSVCVPPAGLLPELGRIYVRHMEFLTADPVLLLPDDLLDFSDCSPSKWHEGVYAGSFLLDEISPDHQLVTD